MLGATYQYDLIVPDYKVSILSQLRCWEQPEFPGSGRVSGAFQSSPSLGAGSNLVRKHKVQRKEVSILSQLRCWEQLALDVIYVYGTVFQSSPSLGAGSNTYGDILGFCKLLCFNPLPA